MSFLGPAVAKQLNSNWHKILRRHKSRQVPVWPWQKDSTALSKNRRRAQMRPRSRARSRNASRNWGLAFGTGFQRGEAGSQSFIFGAGLGGHGLDRLEFF